MGYMYHMIFIEWESITEVHLIILKIMYLILILLLQLNVIGIKNPMSKTKYNWYCNWYIITSTWTTDLQRATSLYDYCNVYTNDLPR